MKAKSITFFILLFAVCVLVFGTILLPTNFSVAEDSTFTGISVSDENFTLNMTASSRKGTALEDVTTTITDTTGEQTVTFQCFKWRDLESLNFRLTPTLDSNTTYLTYEFSVSYVRAENMTASLGTSSSTTLSSGAVANANDFSLIYYVDSSVTTSASNTKAGNDFGLYKFNFKYSYLLANNETATISVGEIFVAVLPDDINEIEIPVNLQIYYTVKSSQKLLNAYVFGINTDVFDYVNPDYLVWEVYGTDTDGVTYVLNQSMQQQEQYAGCQIIWESDQSNTGTTFDFDSNNIEGTWIVTLFIKDADGNILATAPSVEVSTIKVEKKSYLWLILLLVFIALLFLVLIALLIIVFRRNKKEAVW